MREGGYRLARCLAYGLLTSTVGKQFWRQMPRIVEAGDLGSKEGLDGDARDPAIVHIKPGPVVKSQVEYATEQVSEGVAVAHEQCRTFRIGLEIPRESTIQSLPAERGIGCLDTVGIEDLMASRNGWDALAQIHIGFDLDGCLMADDCLGCMPGSTKPARDDAVDGFDRQSFGCERRLPHAGFR